MYSKVARYHSHKLPMQLADHTFSHDADMQARGGQDLPCRLEPKWLRSVCVCVCVCVCVSVCVCVNWSLPRLSFFFSRL